MKPFSALLLFAAAAFAHAASAASELPNILWITSEDNGPHLGCYGDAYATTPRLDALAGKSLRYTRASSNAPVCAPARTTVISGIYPPATGSEHMRSLARLPEGFRMFPQFLREAGYYCTNNAKEDYNLARPAGDPAQGDPVWDESSSRAHWKNRAEGQPFFAVFNFTISHESQIRNEIPREHQIHDPGAAPVPAYHPDTPETRRDWAQYYDRLTMMDRLCGEALDEMEAAGLGEDTIVFYWGDHGSGMPRSKRWPYNSGLHVPLLAHFPEKWLHLAPEGHAPGGTSDRLVSFLDLAPTMLSLAGIAPPDWMQGRAFAGPHSAPAPEFSHGFRGRMDERYDMIRSVMGPRHVYLRNYMPHRIYGQYIQYMFQTPTTRIWQEKHLAGELDEIQSRFWQKKPAEELYDLEADPDETRNLADSPEHREILERMRAAHRDWTLEVRDLGFLPEAEIHARAASGAPYDHGHSEDYHLETIFAAANLATSLQEENLPTIVGMLDHEDSGVRWWGAIGLLCHEEAGAAAGRAALQRALEDECGSVAIVAAEALGRFGSGEGDLEKALDVLLAKADLAGGNVFESILAGNGLDHLGEKARSRLEQIKSLPSKPDYPAPRAEGYLANLLAKIIADLEGGGE